MKCAICGKEASYLYENDDSSTVRQIFEGRCAKHIEERE